MQKFVNRLTGSIMWVADDRAEEYKAAGHAPVVSPAAKEPAKRPARKVKR